MGLFDFVEDLVDEIVEAPGKIAKTAIKTVGKAPNLIKKTGEGILEGLEEVTDDLLK